MEHSVDGNPETMNGGKSIIPSNAPIPSAHAANSYQMSYAQRISGSANRNYPVTGGGPSAHNEHSIQQTSNRPFYPKMNNNSPRSKDNHSNSTMKESGHGKHYHPGVNTTDQSYPVHPPLRHNVNHNRYFNPPQFQPPLPPLPPTKGHPVAAPATAPDVKSGEQDSCPVINATVVAERGTHNGNGEIQASYVHGGGRKMDTVKCHRCGEKGHIAPACPNKHQHQSSYNKPRVCRFWMAGHCQRGDDCTFFHGALPTDPSNMIYGGGSGMMMLGAHHAVMPVPIDYKGHHPQYILDPSSASTLYFPPVPTAGPVSTMSYSSSGAYPRSGSNMDVSPMTKGGPASSQDDGATAYAAEQEGGYMEAPYAAAVGRMNAAGYYPPQYVPSPYGGQPAHGYQGRESTRRFIYYSSGRPCYDIVCLGSGVVRVEHRNT
jgi:hypothetical protein